MYSLHMPCIDKLSYSLCSFIHEGHIWPASQLAACDALNCLLIIQAVIIISIIAPRLQQRHGLRAVPVKDGWVPVFVVVPDDILAPPLLARGKPAGGEAKGKRQVQE